MCLELNAVLTGKKIVSIINELEVIKMIYDDNNIFAKIFKEKYLVKKFMKMNMFYLFMTLILKKKFMH